MNDDEILLFLKQHQCGHYKGSHDSQMFLYAWNQQDFKPLDPIPSILTEIEPCLRRHYENRKCRILNASVSSSDNWFIIQISPPKQFL
jgi:hypothetical protein